MEKILVIGWDGATFDLLDPWLAAGDLPNLASLARAGVRGRIQSVPTMNSGPAWTTVATGVNAGKHGIYGLVELEPGAYRMRHPNRTHCRAATIWRRLSQAGKRVIVMSLPVIYPAEPVNGFLVAGGDAPSTRSPGFTYPAGLIKEISKEGAYILATRPDALIRSGKKGAALDGLERMVESQTRAALSLMRRQPWDFGFILFTASDTVQHYFWEDLAGGPYQDGIARIFRRLDESLGRLLAQAGDETAVVLLSDHGFGPRQPGYLYINHFLAELGLLRYRSRPNVQNNLWSRAFRQLEKLLGDATKDALVQRFPSVHAKAIASLWSEDIDWSATRAFSLGVLGEIWVNLRGRQPEGIVSPGVEYNEVVAQVQQALTEAVNLDTGRPAIRAVSRREELYHGPFTDQAPDLLVEWADELCESGLGGTVGGRRVAATRRITHVRYLFNGGHRKMGVLVASGPPFKAGATIEGATLYDVAPTLLHLLDQPIPTSFDGRILTDALADSWRQAHPPRFVDEAEAAPAEPGSPLSAQDEEEIMGRLRALGYVD